MTGIDPFAVAAIIAIAGVAQAAGMRMHHAHYRQPSFLLANNPISQGLSLAIEPHMGDAGDYSSTIHYLKAIEAAGTDEAQAVMSKMRELPINDFFAKNGRIREDGRMVHDMYVYEVKKPSESKGEWDYYKLREVIPGDQAFRPLKDSVCPLVKKG